MSQNQQDFIAGMGQMLKGHGFENVVIRPAPLPQYIVDSLNDARDAAKFEYYRVATGQGNFGIIVSSGSEQILDFAGTGIALNDFYPDEVVAELPSDFPFIVPLEDSEQLLLLWQLLTKKNARP